MHCKHEKNKSKGKNKTENKTRTPLPPPNLGGEKKRNHPFSPETGFGFFFFSPPLIPFSFFSHKDGKIWAVVGWFGQAPKQGTQ